MGINAEAGIKMVTYSGFSLDPYTNYKIIRPQPLLVILSLTE